MLTNQSHRIFIALAAILMLFLGILIGNYMVENLGGEAIDPIKIGLLFTAIILILLIGRIGATLAQR
ncbi:hypothetical protein HYW19_01080 [Candidatus Woesearchaeota archaeon]|nr:hypothetical protein [Candidatus Woesearchaeota archaeon]